MASEHQDTVLEGEPEGPRTRRRRGPAELGPITTRLIQLNQGVERVIAVTVVALLVLVAVLILFGSLGEIIDGLRHGGEYNLTRVLSEILLALMIAEIIGTVSSFLRQGVFDPIPFLVVGIIASVRRLLVISAESAELFSKGHEIPYTILIELGILTVTIGVCAWAITALRRSSAEEASEPPTPEPAEPDRAKL